MSAENDLALAYHMGYDDALAKRKPDASKAQVLAPYDLAAENAKLREQGERLFDKTLELGTENAKLRELFNETSIRLVAANEAAGGGFMDARYCELLESHGIEVGEWANE